MAAAAPNALVGYRHDSGFNYRGGGAEADPLGASVGLAQAEKQKREREAQLIDRAMSVDAVDEYVLRKYELNQKLGKGAYGVVWRATDKRTRKPVALKKIYDGFRNVTDAQRTFREIYTLLLFKGHDNIVDLKALIWSRANKGLDLYCSFGCMDTDLFSAIRAGVLQDPHKQYCVYQISKALAHLHSADIVHRDIKPSNILINANCHVRLCDFGLVRHVAHVQEKSSHNSVGTVMTDYVGCRWYRSPEVLLGSVCYLKPVDMWSLGCILGEMLIGTPLFQGMSTMNQVEKVLEVTGRPSPMDIDALHSPFAATMLESVPPTNPRALSEIFCNASAEALDFLRLCLQFNPLHRLKSPQALRHPYVAEFCEPDDELPFTKQPLPLQMPLGDDTRATKERYREEVDKMVVALTREGHKTHGYREKFGYTLIGPHDID